MARAALRLRLQVQALIDSGGHLFDPGHTCLSLPGHVDTRVWRAAGEENFAHFTRLRAKIEEFYVLLLLGTEPRIDGF